MGRIFGDPASRNSPGGIGQRVDQWCLAGRIDSLVVSGRKHSSSHGSVD